MTWGALTLMTRAQAPVTRAQAPVTRPPLPQWQRAQPLSFAECISCIRMLVRAARLIKYAKTFAVITNAFGRSRDHLIVLFIFLLISTILAGSVVFQVVKASSTPDTLRSVPDTFFFVLQQLADLTALDDKHRIVLDTTMGHVIGLVMMACGVVFHGLTMGAIMHGFREAMDEQISENSMRRKLKKTFKHARNADGRAMCSDLRRAVRNTWPALAIALEPFGNLLITEKFFDAIVLEAGDMDMDEHAVDTAELFTAIELLHEDQAMIHDALSEQSRLLQKLAEHHQIDLGTPRLPLPDGKVSHFYICCVNVDDPLLYIVQTNLEKAGAIVHKGEEDLEQRWYNATGRIQNTVAFVLLVTHGTLRSGVCLHEVQLAMDDQLPLVVVYDADKRRASSVDLNDECNGLPEEVRALVEYPAELVPLGRRADSAENMTKEILRQSNIATSEVAI